MLESEGHNRDHKAIIFFIPDKNTFQLHFQLSGQQIGGVDYIIRHSANTGQDLFFLPHTVFNPAFQGKWMHTSAFLVTLDQCFLISVHKENLQIVTTVFDMLQNICRIFERLTRTHIQSQGSFTDFLSLIIQQFQKFIYQ